MKNCDPLWDLAYWQTGEYQVIEERLDDHERTNLAYVPTRSLLFHSLSLIHTGQVRCCIIGQDPYPNPKHATGIAFSVPGQLGSDNLPGSLKNIFKEYQSDLHYPAPKNGDLTTWVNRGVLLWNAYPSCLAWKPGSHHWDEWRPLTEEILGKLDVLHKTVFVLLGTTARSFSSCIRNSPIIETSHPSPLGANKGFLGSRVFSRVNAELCKLKQPIINWRLTDRKQEVC